MLASYHPYQVGSLCHVVGEALSVQRLLPVFEVLAMLLWL